MLRLIESRSHREFHANTTAASAAIHLLLIIAAVYVTTARATFEPQPEKPIRIHWLKPAPLDPSPTINRTRPSPKPNIQPYHPPLSTPNIPVSIVSPSSTLTPQSELSLVAAPPASPAVTVTTAPTTTVESRPFDVSEVEIPAAAVANGVRPEYPPSLRASGIEGQVIAEFVVAETGIADRESVRIISSTNDLFSTAVIRSIPRMRFRPARLGNKPVAQLVQQLFVFRLDR